MGPELKTPIFLIGNYRSGTTITQRLIGLRPEIVTWYEPRTLWLYADPGRDHDEFGEQDASPKVIRYIRRRFLRYQSRNGGRRIMENTPSNVLRVPYVHAIFPEATYLFITRNPFSCISSIELKWKNTKTWSGLLRTLSNTPLTQLHYYAGDFIEHMIMKRVLKKKYSSIFGPRYKGIGQDIKKCDRLTVVARQWARCNRKAREDLAKLASACSHFDTRISSRTRGPSCGASIDTAGWSATTIPCAPPRPWSTLGASRNGCASTGQP